MDHIPTHYIINFYYIFGLDLIKKLQHKNKQILTT